MKRKEITVGSILKGAFAEFKRNAGMYLLVALAISLLGFVSGKAGLSYVASAATLILYPGIALEFYKSNKEKRKSTFGGIFDQINGPVMKSYFLSLLYTFLWSLLLVVPGIVKGLAYQRAIYITSKNKNIAGQEALQQSEEEMRGYKWKLFVANFILALPVIILAIVLFAILINSILFLLTTPTYEAVNPNFANPNFATEHILSLGGFGLQLIAIIFILSVLSFFVGAIQYALAVSFNRQLDEVLEPEREEYNKTLKDVNTADNDSSY